MQMPFGIIADKLNRNSLIAIIGCLLAGAAYGVASIPVAAAVIIGLGNAMFHIGGGIDVLNISAEKPGALGVFVSPGAFGIYFGAMLGRGTALSAYVMPLVLAAAAALILLLHTAQKGNHLKNAEFSLDGIGSRHIAAAIACFFLVVCLRSFVGLALDFPWKGLGFNATALICAVVIGKVIGGFAAGRFGTAKIAAISLGAAAILFLFPSAPAPGIAAVLLFNMTMPITLWATAKIMPGAKGFAFGLLTFGIFIGFLPVYLGIGMPSAASWLFALLAAASLAILWAGLRKSAK